MPYLDQAAQAAAYLNQKNKEKNRDLTLTFEAQLLNQNVILSADATHVPEKDRDNAIRILNLTIEELLNDYKLTTPDDFTIQAYNIDDGQTFFLLWDVDIITTLATMHAFEIEGRDPQAVNENEFRQKKDEQVLQQLFECIENSKQNHLRALLQQYPDRGLHAKHNRSGDTLLHIAADRNDAETIRILRPYLTTETINARDQHGKTALMRAAAAGRTAAVKQLLEIDATNVNCDYYDNATKTPITALWLALTNFHITITENILGDQRFDPSSITDQSLYPLHYLASSCKSGQDRAIATFKAVVKSDKFDLHSVDENGETILHKFAQIKGSNNQHLSSALATAQWFLQQQGVESQLSMTDSQGRTPLMLADSIGNSDLKNLFTSTSKPTTGTAFSSEPDFNECKDDECKDFEPGDQTHYSGDSATHREVSDATIIHESRSEDAPAQHDRFSFKKCFTLHYHRKHINATRAGIGKGYATCQGILTLLLLFGGMGGAAYCGWLFLGPVIGLDLVGNCIGAAIGVIGGYFASTIISLLANYVFSQCLPRKNSGDYVRMGDTRHGLPLGQIPSEKTPQPSVLPSSKVSQTADAPLIHDTQQGEPRWSKPRSSTRSSV